jgi:hypothetical protein
VGAVFVVDWRGRRIFFEVREPLPAVGRTQNIS